MKAWLRPSVMLAAGTVEITRGSHALLKSSQDVETQEDHEIVGEETEGDFAVLAVIASCAEGGAEIRRMSQESPWAYPQDDQLEPHDMKGIRRETMEEWSGADSTLALLVWDR